MVPGFVVSAECQSIGTSGQKQRACYLTPKTLSCVYFELSFLGCGFLIHLSNQSDSPRFRAPWKKIRQKYWTQQETSLFKGPPLSCQGQEVEGLLFNPKISQLVHILRFRSQGVFFLFIFPTGQIALDSEPRGRRYVKNTGHNRNRLYSRAIHCPAQSVISYTLLSRNH